MSDLPKGWEEIQLKEIVKTRKGKKPNVLQTAQTDGLIPYLDIHAIERNVPRQFADVQSSRIGTKKDVFIVWDGARSGWVGLGKDGAIGSTITALESLVTEQDYLFYFLKSQFHYINSNTRGTGIPHVDPEIFNNIEVPLAPLNEQKRIVEKLEKLLGKVEAVQARLDKIPVILKRFRQAVLAAACSGRLTANPERKLWRDEPFLNLLSESLCNGHSVVNSDVGFPVLRLTCLKNGLIDLNERKIGNWTEQEAKKYIVKLGDFFISRGSGSLTHVGRAGLLTTVPDKVAFPDTLIRARVNHQQLSPSFLALVWESRIIREQVEDVAHTTAGIFKINQKQIEKFVLPVPPFEEQKEIVRRVEDLFIFADQIEARYKKARSYTDKLTQSILAKAFRGELVPQDERDEPADILLERIKAEGKTVNNSKKKQRNLFNAASK